MKNCLTIAGSDCSGGAGIQADLKTFSAHQVYGMSVITSVVAENTSEVIKCENLSANIISSQINAVFDDIEVDGVKIGMIKSFEIMNTVANGLEKYSPKIVVCDSVMSAKDGHSLMDLDALQVLKARIIPLCTMLTPNIPEAEIIADIEIETIDDMKSAAKIIFEMGAKSVLIKGGHFEGDCTDVLYNGTDFWTFEQKRINTKNTHGTGCTLSSAITANLANGLALDKSVENAKNYLTGAIENSLEIGKGNGPLHHFYKLY